MTLTIEVPDKIAARVHALHGEERRRIDQAAAIVVAVALNADTNPERFGNFAAAVDTLAPATPTFDTSKKYWERFAAKASRNIHLPSWSEEAFSRESIYEDRW